MVGDAVHAGAGTAGLHCTCPHFGLSDGPVHGPVCFLSMHMCGKKISRPNSAHLPRPPCLRLSAGARPWCAWARAAVARACRPKDAPSLELDHASRMTRIYPWLILHSSSLSITRRGVRLCCFIGHPAFLVFRWPPPSFSVSWDELEGRELPVIDSLDDIRGKRCDREECDGRCQH